MARNQRDIVIMITALVIISSILFLENIALIALYLNRNSKKKKLKDKAKMMRTEFNSAMVNLRRLESLLKETARED